VGQTLTLVINATVTATSGTVTNTAVGTSTTPDPTPTNTTTLAVPVVSSADLTLTKVASSATGTAGGTISYTVTLVNLGPSVAQNVTLTDILGAGLSLISASGNNGTTTSAIDLTQAQLLDAASDSALKLPKVRGIASAGRASSAAVGSAASGGSGVARSSVVAVLTGVAASASAVLAWFAAPKRSVSIGPHRGMSGGRRPSAGVSTGAAAASDAAVNAPDRTSTSGWAIGWRCPHRRQNLAADEIT